MNDLIMDSGNLAEIEGLDASEDNDLSDLTATKTEATETMDFHVQMRGYTMRDFEAMVINAAAHQLMQGRTFKSEIEAKAIEIASSKVNARLNDVLKDVMQMTVATRGKEPVTLGQMIGMEAKDYLTASVKSDGSPSDGWGQSAPRIVYLVREFAKQHFASEIKAAMGTLIADMKAALEKQLTAAIDEERRKIADALGYEIKKSR